MIIIAILPYTNYEVLVSNEEIRKIQQEIVSLEYDSLNINYFFSSDINFSIVLTFSSYLILNLYYNREHIDNYTIDFYKTISITLGLVFIETSVDHRTTYSIVGEDYF
jgi:4-hydroxy-L-threonine phosphate dehydrogenase PdxA